MLNLNQLKEREDLRAQQAKLGDELAFAEEHKLLGLRGLELESHQHDILSGAWRLRTVHAGGQRFSRRGDFQTSRCPACIRAEQTSVKSSLRKLHVTSLLNDAGITRRFGDCEFENYLELNPEASRNLAACRRYADNWPAFWRPGKVWC
jgi:DNA replication protein DnaC